MKGKSLKFGGSMDYDMKMNWLDFGFHRSKIEVTTGPNMDINSVKMCQAATIIHGKDLLDQCQAFLKI